MANDTTGIVGDRRRNPFPSMNDTEYELFLLTIEKSVNKGVSEAMAKYRQNSCEPHVTSTGHLNTAVFGSTEHGIIGLDDRVSSLERAMATLSRVTWIAVSAFIVAFIGLLVGIIQFAIVGR